MPAMQFTCPYCQGLFEVEESLAGQQVACPLCNGVVTTPGAALSIVETNPAADSLTVRVEKGGTLTLGTAAADKIFVH